MIYVHKFWMAVRNSARKVLPLPLKTWLRRQQRRTWQWPPVGMVRFGGLRRVTPVSRNFGLDRGLCIDRYYIEKFLASHGKDICGRVLEVGDDAYTCKFGGDRVERADILDVTEDNLKATIIADLTCADHVESDAFDCIILTQTLQLIYDVRAALKHLYRILKPGGVLLATFPGISQISRYDMERWGDFWRFTSLSARNLFAEVFPEECVTIKVYGNVLASVAFLHGLAAGELNPEELNHHDPDYEVVIALRAVKPQGNK